MNKTLTIILLAIFCMASACEAPKETVVNEINDMLRQQEGTFAVAFKDLRSGEEILINEKEFFHAASTMKTPVMIEVFRQAATGKFALQDSITVRNEFKSIVDSSTYSLTAEEDSDPEMYKKIGTKMTVNDLVTSMIIVSSNLATNIIIDLVDARNVTKTMRDLGAMDIQVLRGVEDSKAFAKGLNNTVTAYDLMVIFEKLARGEAVDKKSSDDMVNILFGQKFNTIIPARLPKDVRVSHKTGWIKGLHHDSGIVYLPDGSSYVIVLLSKNLKNEDAGINALAAVSEKLYHYFKETK